MARPRIHDLDGVLDVAERLAADGGTRAVTVRAVAAATAMSNGALYHAFGSRSGIVGRAWLRAAHRFLALQRSAAATALDAGTSAPGRAVDAVVAAATAPLDFAAVHSDSARLLLTVDRDDLLGTDLPTDLATALARLDSELVDLFVQLAQALWNRRDGAAVGIVEACLIRLPTGLVLRRRRTPDPALRPHLEAAVRAVLALDPPPAPAGDSSDTKGPR